MTDYRSPEAAAYRKLYKTAKWQRLREAQLMAQPLCERCLVQEIVTEATVAHHRIPHRGDLELFYRGEIESLCASHHDGEAKREEAGKRVVRFDAQGWPV